MSPARVTRGGAARYFGLVEIKRPTIVGQSGGFWPMANTSIGANMPDQNSNGLVR